MKQYTVKVTKANGRKFDAGIIATKAEAIATAEKLKANPQNAVVSILEREVSDWKEAK